MMIAALMENHATIQIEILDINLRHEFGPTITHCDFWHSLPEKHPEILRETLGSLTKPRLRGHVPEASVTKNPCEDDFFFQILLDASPNLEDLHLAGLGIARLRGPVPNRIVQHINLPKLESLCIDDVSLRELSPFMEFLRRDRSTLSRLTLGLMDTNDSSNKRWPDLFQFLAAEMMLKGIHLIGLFQIAQQQHFRTRLLKIVRSNMASGA
jgi:hypothetical protein